MFVNSLKGKTCFTITSRTLVNWLDIVPNKDIVLTMT